MFDIVQTIYDGDRVGGNPAPDKSNQMNDETRDAIKGISYLILTAAIFIAAAWVEGW